MTSIRAKLFAALVAALGLTAMSPAFASGAQHQRPGSSTGPTLDFRRDGGGAFRLAELSCAPRAADRLENRLDRMVRRLDLTSAQRKLFEDFRTTALTAQTDLSDSCATIRPDLSATAERPDLIQRLELRLKLDEAELAAMTRLLPQFKAFYASLSDKQKAELMPGHGFRQGFEAPYPAPRFHRHGAPTPGMDG